ncbi:MAG: cysteine--tRNA ligase [Candidatus Aureabacteria bacterium]|nr:cysteine--tRNA ligase [Candidatus Auribacterota bacterium]
MIKVYNTLARRLEEFTPLAPPTVGMYVCGPTVYDDCHLGHARAMVAFDVIIRWLEYRGYTVRYVRNITDIDDKIIARAAERGVSCAELAERYIAEFHRDMAKLSLREPTVEPRATAHIGAMCALVTRLWEKGLAYESGGDVYYDVGAYRGYGALSGRDISELMAGARVEVNVRKRNPLDFVLWKAAKPGEPQWPSPWGPGRPGWHIECSAMSAAYLGAAFDIHGGGQDLIFPHHENEIAQSAGSTGSIPARYWLHNAHVTVDRTKMSKSLGNFFTLKEIYRRYDPAVVRFLLLGKHYRTPIDYSDTALAEAGAALRRIGGAVSRAGAALGVQMGDEAHCPAAFETAMDEDFNSTEAMGILFSLASGINVDCDGKKAGWKDRVARNASALIHCCRVLGIGYPKGEAVRVTDAAEELDRGEVERLIEASSIGAGQVERLLRARNALRKAREFALADRIRERLQQLGYDLRDERQAGSVVRKKGD